MMIFDCFYIFPIASYDDIRLLLHFSFSCCYDVKPATIKEVSALEIPKVPFHCVNKIVFSPVLSQNCLFD